MGKWKQSIEEDKKMWLCHSVSNKGGDRIIETKKRGDHVGLAIAYWLLPTTLALSHYCHVKNQKWNHQRWKAQIIPLFLILVWVARARHVLLLEWES